MFSRNNNYEFWSNSEIVKFYDENTYVPSLNDFVWILMRTDLMNRVCIPRLKDTIELSLILNKGYEVNYSLIHKRAVYYNIPNIPRALFCSLERYTGINNGKCYNSKPDTIIIYKWESWSVRYRKTYLFDDDILHKTEKDFAALRFFTAGTLTLKISFIIWLLHYHRRIYIVEILEKTGLSLFIKNIIHLIKKLTTFLSGRYQ